MDHKHLKFNNTTHTNFDGNIGVHTFKGGVSVEKISRVERDRLSAAMNFHEINEDGSSHPAGPAYRLVAEAATRAPVLVDLERQTEMGKAAEVIKMSQETSFNPPIYTYEELTAIADKSGITGIREVAIHWNVKHRALVVLIQMILDSQQLFEEAKQSRVDAKAAQEAEKAKVNAPAIDSTTAARLAKELNDAEDAAADADLVQPVGDVQTEVENVDILAAAVSGDLGAALVEPTDVETVEPAVVTPAEVK